MSSDFDREKAKEVQGVKNSNFARGQKDEAEETTSRTTHQGGTASKNKADKTKKKKPKDGK